MPTNERVPAGAVVGVRDAIATSLSFLLAFSVGLVACGGRGQSKALGTGGSDGGGAGGGGSSTGGGSAGSGGPGTGGMAGRGSAANGGSGSGGSGSGGAGTGGTPGTGGSALTCSGTLGQPTAPVIVTATLQCNDTLGDLRQVNVGAGSANSGFVALFGDHSRVGPGFFFDISPSAVQVQQVPSGDAMSLPSNASGAFCVLSGGVDRGSVSWSSRSGTGTGQLTTTTGMDTMSSSSFIDGALGPDGTQYAVFGRSDTTLALLSRPAGGGAFAVSTVYPMLTPYVPRLVVDAAKTPHFVSWIPDQGLFDSPQGQALVTLLASTVQQAPPWRPSRPGGGDFAVSVILADGVHVLRRGTGSAFDDIPIAGTPATNAYVSLPAPCPCSTVTQMGDFVSSAALARASDGTLWLVTIRDHLDRSIPYKYDGGEACQCQATLADDHSTRTVAVQRIAPGATAPSAILWSQNVSLQPWTNIGANTLILDASFLGSSLFFAIVNSATAASLVTVSYYVMDTTTLH